MKHRDHLVGFLPLQPTPSSYDSISPLPPFLILSFPCFSLSQCPLTDDYFLLAAPILSFHEPPAIASLDTPALLSPQKPHLSLSSDFHFHAFHSSFSSSLSALDVRASRFGWPMNVVRHLLPTSVLVARPSISKIRVSSSCCTSSLPKPGFFLRLLFHAGFRFKHHLFLFSFPIFLSPLIRWRSKIILDLRALQTRFDNSDQFTMHVLYCSDIEHLYY